MGQQLELPRIAPRFSPDNLSQPINLLQRDGDPRKAEYFVHLALQAREYWHKLIGETGIGYSPSIFRMLEQEGFFANEMLFPNEAQDALTQGKSVRVRRGSYEVRKHMVPEHTLTVMAGVGALADRAIEKGLLRPTDRRDLLVEAGLHDLNKDIESKAIGLTINDKEAGYGQAGYDLAAEVSRQKLKIAGVPDEVISVTEMVGHASCPAVEFSLAGYRGIAKISPGFLKMLILHYVDDIVTNPNIIDPSVTVDTLGNRLNALDRRCIQNENNPRYIHYNQSWKSDPRNRTGETAFQMQRRVGHLVEAKLASLFGIDDPLTLPQVVYERMQQNIQTFWDKKSRQDSKS